MASSSTVRVLPCIFFAWSSIVLKRLHVRLQSTHLYSTPVEAETEEAVDPVEDEEAAVCLEDLVFFDVVLGVDDDAGVDDGVGVLLAGVLFAKKLKLLFITPCNG